MQASTLEVILRAVFGVADAERRERLRDAARRLLGSTASAGLQFSVLLARRLGTKDPLLKMQALMAEIDAMLAVEIADRRAEGEASGARRICSLLVARVSRTAARWRTARSATS